jgi:rhamnulokinase
MAAYRNYLAIDLGAESGRAISGRFDGQTLALEEVHRFSNGPVRLFDHLYWDPLRLYSEILQGLRRSAASGSKPDAVGIDTWGVDFGLLGRDDLLLDNPRNYRDPRTDGMVEAACARVGRQRIFAETGVQFMKLNTLYQLLAMRLAEAPQLEAAQTFLMMPDLLNFWLTGIKTAEFSNATTTQCYDPSRGDWARSLLEDLDIPTAMLPPIAAPGDVVGSLLPSVGEQTGLGAVKVIAPATHDTGSAVAAVPTVDADYAYISSGTWSLMGVELDSPNLSAAALEHNFTNEGGVDGTFRFLKNIMGLWLVQECRRTWENQGRTFSYAELAAKAEAAPAFAALVDPDDESFLAPGDMPERIRAFCQRSGQKPPADEGAMVRCILESLALKYRLVLERLETTLGRRLERIHMVGGGIQNRLLCRFTAEATGRPLVAGPLEATAIGNLLMQALGCGDVASLAEAREVVRRSFEPEVYSPQNGAAWDQAYQRFIGLA